MNLKTRQFIWGIVLFISGMQVLIEQVRTMIYVQMNLIQLVVEILVLLFAIFLTTIGAIIINKTLE